MGNMTKEQIRYFENISSNAFVGLEEIVYDGWELRFTHGFTGRANSVQIKGGSTIELTEKIEFCEKEYAKHDLPCIFKLNEADKDFISVLQNRGYQVVKPTDVMLLSLKDTVIDNEILKDVSFSSTSDGWFESYFEFENMQDEMKQDLTRKIHAKVSVDQVYIKVMHDGKVAAVASLAIEEGYSLLHNVVVSPDLRGMGLGKKLCQAAILISKRSGATHIYLQVMQNNPIARDLYNKLGFEKQYTYYYVVSDNRLVTTPL
ncbi:MAG: GNAT family N-acetyltransferase [Clostridia bacterium]|nr:GNAT family N-acetyltransferase [Clostridia bacterium]